jgi:hypothetical protein
MGPFHAVAPAGDVGEGTMARPKQPDATIAVADQSSTFFAFDDACTDLTGGGRRTGTPLPVAEE